MPSLNWSDTGLVALSREIILSEDVTTPTWRGKFFVLHGEEEGYKSFSL